LPTAGRVRALFRPHDGPYAVLKLLSVALPFVLSPAVNTVAVG